MFTGIIKNKAEFVSLKKDKSKYFLTLSTVQKFTNKDIGSSISINGICLTLIRAKLIKNKCQIMFYLSPETLRLSNLRFLKKNENVNIEKSLRFGDEISGHFVQGHVDDCSSISKINIKQGSWYINIKYKQKFKKYIIKKGSIAINGVSLTIVSVSKNYFQLVIIPHSLKLTNLINLKKNDKVNVEFDIILKYLNR
jgi:riboflavin synthase, alpha subunit